MKPAPAAETSAPKRPSVPLLETGRRYRVTYAVDGLRRPRQMLALLMERREDPGCGTLLLFSGRPEFGTTPLRSRQVLAAEEVTTTEACYADRVVR
jgi:hypothetical protein